MELLKGIALLALLAATANAKSIATYDQRQEGKVNVQIDVKDVSILALVDSDMLEDYASYDYAYDYADFTIKPSRPTTSAKPAMIEDTSPASTEKPSNASSATADSSSEDLSAASTQSTTSATASADNTTGTTDSKIIEIIVNPTSWTIAATEASSSTTAAVPSSSRRPAGIAEPRKKCPVGFLLKSGRCFKRRLSLISPRFAMMKLAPALLSRAKALTKNLASDDS